MLFMLNSHKVDKFHKLNSAFSTPKTTTCIYRGAARPPTLARNGPEPVLITYTEQWREVLQKESPID
jgi:hypothetical protein